VRHSWRGEDAVDYRPSSPPCLAHTAARRVWVGVLQVVADVGEDLS
jgi:hypothetical protein